MSLLKFYIIFIAWIFRITFRIKSAGSGNIPDGRCILCANHTSMLDPVMMILAMKRKAYENTKVMAKIELSRVPALGFLIKPFTVFIDRGRSDMGAIKKTIEGLENGDKFIIFPEGTRVDNADGSQAKTGVALMAVKSGAPIVPVYITSCRKPMFSFKRVDVIFGEPYYPVKDKSLSTSEAYRRIADEMMGKIFELGNGAR
ncbi:MAG: 1-acyl-sn-glycerol-3-phosphate acyltransferase [Oscillospiraceae bacterium]|jgi:1-acyl-sn-glycerol-3-phosphate acyltransferase|nr:1-acyl-sn-glycerol-3-phosphate acyltransferase [Oscillospiraceae bacterium]